MPAYNFQRQFADDVEQGRKPGTIRAKRKNRPRVGQTAHCFVGMRTSACRCLGRWPIALVCDIDIYEHGVFLDGVEVLSLATLNILARTDGFRDWPSMQAWFKKTHGLPFYGDWVLWDWRPA